MAEATAPEDAPLDADIELREIDLDAAEAIEVAVPYPHDEFICPSPNCGRAIEWRKQIILSKPARYAHLLNDVLKCPYCGIIFSYKTSVARVIRG